MAAGPDRVDARRAGGARARRPARLVTRRGSTARTRAPTATAQYPGQYGKGSTQGQFGRAAVPDGQYAPGGQYPAAQNRKRQRPDGGGAGRRPGLLGKLPFKRPLIPVAIGGGLVVVVVAAVALSAQRRVVPGTAAAAPRRATPTAPPPPGPPP